MFYVFFITFAFISRKLITWLSLLTPVWRYPMEPYTLHHTKTTNQKQPLNFKKYETFPRLNLTISLTWFFQSQLFSCFLWYKNSGSMKDESWVVLSRMSFHRSNSHFIYICCIIITLVRSCRVSFGSLDDNTIPKLFKWTQIGLSPGLFPNNTTDVTRVLVARFVHLQTLSNRKRNLLRPLLWLFCDQHPSSELLETLLVLRRRLLFSSLVHLVLRHSSCGVDTKTFFYFLGH